MSSHVIEGKYFRFKIDDVKGTVTEYIDPVKMAHVEYGDFEFLLKQLILEHVKNGVNIKDAGYQKGLDNIIGNLKAQYGL
jgi:hypothetical protein